MKQSHTETEGKKLAHLHTKTCVRTHAQQQNN